MGVMGDPAGAQGNLQVLRASSPGPRRCAAAEMSQLLFFFFFLHTLSDELTKDVQT